MKLLTLIFALLAVDCGKFSAEQSDLITQDQNKLSFLKREPSFTEIRTAISPKLRTLIQNAEYAIGPRRFFTLITLNNKLQRCGGAVIAPQWVLTAAHCVFSFKANEIEVEVGDFNNRSAKKDAYKVKGLYPHPRYVKRQPTYDPFYDIGLIKLQAPVRDPNRTVIPVCNKRPPNAGPFLKMLGLCGMGRLNCTNPYSGTDILQETFLFEKEEERGFKLRRNENRCGWEQICVDTTVRDSIVCQGDSGSPLYLMGFTNCGWNKPQCLYGVASHKLRMIRRRHQLPTKGRNRWEDEEYQMFFTSVPFFYRWIVDTITNPIRFSRY